MNASKYHLRSRSYLHATTLVHSYKSLHNTCTADSFVGGIFQRQNGKLEPAPSTKWFKPGWGYIPLSQTCRFLLLFSRYWEIFGICLILRRHQWSVVAGGAVARGRLHLLVVVDVLGHLPDLRISKHEAFVSTGWPICSRKRLCWHQFRLRITSVWVGTNVNITFSASIWVTL